MNYLRQKLLLTAHYMGHVIYILINRLIGQTSVASVFRTQKCTMLVYDIRHHKYRPVKPLRYPYLFKGLRIIILIILNVLERRNFALAYTYTQSVFGIGLEIRQYCCLGITFLQSLNP